MKLMKNFFQKSIGMMFRKEATDLLFTFDKDVDFSVWTPFVNFPIDVFFLDGKYNVLEARKAMQPWKFHSPKGKYRYFFESAAGKYNEKKVSHVVKKALN